MIIGNREFDVNKHTYIMGILNITQDSFSDGGRFIKPDAALKQAEKMISEGADIIDVGGESTRPGFTEIEADEEISRVVPVIELIRREFDIPVSLDTRKAGVAGAGIAAGADLINDIWGLREDPQMAETIASSGKPCVLMHNRREDRYHSLMEDICLDLSKTLKLAEEAGIKDENIILDPGIGFAKNTEENLEVLNNLELIGRLGFPVLLGASRKSVIGNTLKLPAEERLEGTLALTALAVSKGVSFVRVHDVKENRRVIDMLEAVYGRN